MRKFITSIAAMAAITVAGLQASAQTDAQYPPDAQAGQCYARVLVPEVTEVITEQVEVTPETTNQVLIPASYETQTIRVMIKEASVERRAIPAIYETVTDKILVRESTTELVSIPAQYETWTETVEIEPAKAVWKTGSGLYGRNGDLTTPGIEDAIEIATGEVLCRVIEPAKTRTVRRSRMVSPPSVERRMTPAVYKTVSRQVVARPARVEEIAIPAEYLDVPVTVMATPEQTRMDTIPATYRTIEKRVVTSRGGLQWSEVLCETNTSSVQIAAIQRSLTSAGYPAAADGVYGPQTQRAMENYQRANGLAAGYLTVETVRSLGLNPYTTA